MLLTSVSAHKKAGAFPLHATHVFNRFQSWDQSTVHEGFIRTSSSLNPNQTYFKKNTTMEKKTVKEKYGLIYLFTFCFSIDVSSFLVLFYCGLFLPTLIPIQYVRRGAS